MSQKNQLSQEQRAALEGKKAQALRELEDKSQRALEDIKSKRKILEEAYEKFEATLREQGLEEIRVDVSDEIDQFFQSTVQEKKEQGLGAVEYLVAKGEGDRVYYCKIKVRPEGVSQKTYYQQGPECRVLKDGEWVSSRIILKNDKYLYQMEEASLIGEMKEQWFDLLDRLEKDVQNKRNLIQDGLRILLEMAVQEKLAGGELMMAEEDVENVLIVPVDYYTSSNKEVPIWSYEMPNGELYLSYLRLEKNEKGRVESLCYILKEYRGKYSVYRNGRWIENG